MIKRVVIALALLLVSEAALAQVKLSIPDTMAGPGSSLILPINVENFLHIGSFSLTIAFDKNVLTYKEISNAPKFGIFNATPAAAANSSGAVALSWFNVSPSINIQRGKLLDLHFTYKKGTSPVTFSKMVPSSVTDSLANNLQATIKNGKVSLRALSRDSKKVKLPTGVK